MMTREDIDAIRAEAAALNASWPDTLAMVEAYKKRAQPQAELVRKSYEPLAAMPDDLTPFEEGLACAIGEVVRAACDDLRTELLERLEARVGEIRADLTVASTVTRGEIAEIRKRRDA